MDCERHYRLAALGVANYLGTRFLRSGGHMSRPLCMYGSMAAGCGQATRFTRVFLYDLLEEMNKASPYATVEEFVAAARPMKVEWKMRPYLGVLPRVLSARKRAFSVGLPSESFCTATSVARSPR